MWTKLSSTTWKMKFSLSSETTHLEVHHWTLATLHQGSHGHQVSVVPTRVPRRASMVSQTAAQTRTITSTPHNGDRTISGTLAMLTHQEVQTANCTVCRRAKVTRAKVVVSTGFATVAESQATRPSSALQRVERQEERDKAKRESAKVGMIATVGQLERDGQMERGGTLQAKVGSNKGQKE